MTAKEFCYWLQGFFELCEANDVEYSLNARAIKAIKAHLALVAMVDAEHNNTFVAWLALWIKDVSTLAPQGIAEMRRHLGAQFKHAIDASYSVDPKKAQSAHDGRPPFDRDQVMRC